MRGGYRIGAGRRKGYAAKGAEEARKLFAARVAQEIVPLTEMLIGKAVGGDIRAAQELFDRAWGKAPQAIDIGGSTETRHILIISAESAQRYGIASPARALPPA